MDGSMKQERSEQQHEVREESSLASISQVRGEERGQGK